MIKGAIRMYATVAYVLVFVVASAGAITHGFNSGEHFYTVMGVMNLIAGGYATYKVCKSEEKK